MIRETAVKEKVRANYADNLVDPPDFDDSLERFSKKNFIDDVRRLSVVNGWRSSAWIAWHWSVVVLAFWFAIHWGTWWAYFLAGLTIATRQQALGVMLHDAVHHLLYRNRKVNNLVSDIFLAFPLGLSSDLYRGTHFQHHRHTGGPLDPDLSYQREDRDWFQWPKTKWGCRWIIVKSLLGLNVGKAVTPLKLWSPWYNLWLPLNGKPAFPLINRVILISSTLLIYGFIFGYGLLVPAILLWAIPGLTLLNFVNRLRATAEHLGTVGTHELNATRTVIPTWFERLTIAPYGVSYHLEHHLFPSVPGPKLAELHRLLMKDETYRERAHITHSYVNVVRELMSQPRHDQCPVTQA